MNLNQLMPKEEGKISTMHLASDVVDFRRRGNSDFPFPLTQ